MRVGRIKCIIFFTNAEILGVPIKIEYLRYPSPTTALIPFFTVFVGLLL